jgi:hypothetical protein
MNNKQKSPIDSIIIDLILDHYNLLSLTNKIDAKKGEVYIEDGVEKPQPVKKFSLYGEEV